MRLSPEANLFMWRWLFKLTPATWIHAGCNHLKKPESLTGRWGLFVTVKYWEA